MSIEKPHENGLNGSPAGSELTGKVDNAEWNKIKESMTPDLEEVERILREEPMIDASEVNRLLGIADEEIAQVLASPPPREMFRT